LGTLKEADRILFMEQGVILEEGNWAALMARGGAFANLASQQGA
jgi:ATP-binding cassette subfamily B protein